MKRILLKLWILAGVVLLVSGSLVYGLNFERSAVVRAMGYILGSLGVIHIAWFFIVGAFMPVEKPLPWKLLSYAVTTFIIAATAVIQVEFVPKEFILQVIMVPMMSAVLTVLFLRWMYPGFGRSSEFDGQLAVIGCGFIGFLGVLGWIVSDQSAYGATLIYFVFFGLAGLFGRRFEPETAEQRMRREKMEWRRRAF